MKQMKKRILFVGHSAGFTGAPIILLRLINWLKANTDMDIKILLKTDGELRASYEEMGPVFLYNSPLLKSKVFNFLIHETNKGFFHFFNKKIKLHNRLKNNIPPSSVDLIFANTITNGEILSSLSYLKCPIICRVAELEFWINRSGYNNFNHVKNYVSHFIAVSETVKQNLVLNHDIQADKIDVVHGFISSQDKISNLKNVRDVLKIPKDGIVIGSSGAEVWRKGKDLFIQLAINVFNKCNGLPIYFVWIGGSKEGSEIYQLQHDIRQAELSDRIFLVPEVSNPMDYFAAFDIFAMVSREDPFPLVNLEAASLGKPIVCFENAGGSPEFVEKDAGFVVPYLDLDAMADKVITLAKDEGLRNRLGNRAAKKVQERHDISIAAPKILQVIHRFL